MTDTKQPAALRLADELESEWFADYDIQNAAAELRRLHEVNAELLEALKAIADSAFCGHALQPWNNSLVYREWAQQKALAAIAKAEGLK
jgi:hypothetical protein